MAYCPTCEQEKDVKDFYKHKARSTGRSYQCKSCDKKRAHKQREELSYNKKKDQDLKWRYGISLEQWNQMFADQNGCCAICGIHQSETKKFHTDHDHATGKVRGLLCHHCNTGLGSFRDNEEALLNAINYLRNNK